MRLVSKDASGTARSRNGLRAILDWDDKPSQSLRSDVATLESWTYSSSSTKNPRRTVHRSWYSIISGKNEAANVGGRSGNSPLYLRDPAAQRRGRAKVNWRMSVPRSSRV